MTKRRLWDDLARVPGIIGFSPLYGNKIEYLSSCDVKHFTIGYNFCKSCKFAKYTN